MYFGSSSSFAGDPGFFDVLKRIGRVGLGFATGGPVGALTAALPTRRPMQGPSGFVRPARFLPEVATGFGVGAGTVAANRFLGGGGGATAEAGCPKGYRLNKSDYYTQEGFVPKGTRCVRNRYRNPYNKKAAKRSAYRLKALGTGMKTIKRAVKEANNVLK